MILEMFDIEFTVKISEDESKLTKLNLEYFTGIESMQTMFSKLAGEMAMSPEIVKAITLRTPKIQEMMKAIALRTPSIQSGMKKLQSESMAKSMEKLQELINIIVNPYKILE